MRYVILVLALLHSSVLFALLFIAPAFSGNTNLGISIGPVAPPAGKGYADPEVAAALERANRLVTETGAVGTPLHFSVLFGLWVSTFAGGAIAAGLEHATNFLSIAQSQPSSGPLLIGHRILAHSLIFSGDYRAALAHLETAVSLYRPDEHRDFAFSLRAGHRGRRLCHVVLGALASRLS
jgi:hypothetical protein